MAKVISFGPFLPFSKAERKQIKWNKFHNFVRLSRCWSFLQTKMARYNNDELEETGMF